MLQREFEDFYQVIRIDNEADNLREKREILQRDIETYLPEIFTENGLTLNKSDIRFIDQGSYKYHTTIKSDVVDRDVAVIIPLDFNEYNDPRKIKGMLRDSIEQSRRKVIVKEPCVRAVYEENGVERMHMDLPLYAEWDGEQRLARGKLYSEQFSWELTDVDALNDWFINKLKGREQLRRIICYFKKWRNEAYESCGRDHAIPPSIGLTILAIESYSSYAGNRDDNDLETLYRILDAILNKFIVSYDIYGNLTRASVTTYLPVRPYTDVFKKMKDSSDSYMKDFYLKLKSAVDHLKVALELESDHDAALEVQKVLGDSFPVPEKKARVLNILARREHNFG